MRRLRNIEAAFEILIRPSGAQRPESETENGEAPVPPRRCFEGQNTMLPRWPL
jgi:hypothetical protein